MRIVLLWHRSGGADADPAGVAKKLQALFSPVLKQAPIVTVRQSASASLVLLELPVKGWRRAFFEEDEDGWAATTDYPLAAESILRARGSQPGAGAVLPALGRCLQEDPASLLARLAPPFSLIWHQKRSGRTSVHNDGLGQAQLFELEFGGLWAVSNKIAAFKALGVPLEVDSEQWAVRATLGWFPLQTTGFKGIRFLPPGTRIRLGADGLERKQYEVLSRWLDPAGLERADCLELARTSLLEQISALGRLCDEPSAGLSGGWDSRAVVASLRRAGTAFSARVRGLPDHPDVRIALQLAKIAGLALRVKKSRARPAPDTETLRRSVGRALLWQAGYMTTSKHKRFLRGDKLLGGGVVTIMGQHGEIGRRYYAGKIEAAGLCAADEDECLVELLMARMPPFTKSRLRDRVRDVIEHACRQADRYGLSGPARLDFFYLHERTRRWASGSLGSQAGLVVAPFLNPDYIRAVFSCAVGHEERNPFHRYIVERNAPDWADVPYYEPVEEHVAQTVGDEAPAGGEAGHWQVPTGKRSYDPGAYWETVGRSIIEEALATDGPQAEIFDLDRARDTWRAAPDELAIVHLLPAALLDA